jgi:hypothetical protein
LENLPRYHRCSVEMVVMLKSELESKFAAFSYTT